jgi:hypothetical protein
MNSYFTSQMPDSERNSELCASLPQDKLATKLIVVL